MYNKGTLMFKLDSSGSPTNITFQVQISPDAGTNWYDLTNDACGGWIYDDTSCASELSEGYLFDLCADQVRVEVTSTGGDGSNYFSVGSSFLMLGN